MAAVHSSLLRHIVLRAAASVPDAVLLQRFVASRDEDAFAGLVRRHGTVVYRVCYGLVGPSAADDAFQATFLVLATRAAAVRKAGSVGSWLVGVAGRVARQMRKAHVRRVGHETAAAKAVPDWQLNEPDRAEAAEQSRILDEELTRLPDRLRGPVVVCLLQGRTYEQAAAELGGSARTVRRRLDEAKKVLRARLERRGVVPAVAAGLTAGVGTANAALPIGLGTRTMATVSDFLAGGAVTLPVVIAKGVATTMTTTVWKLTTLAATAAVGLAALGVGLAGDGRQVPSTAAPPPPLAPPAVPTPARIPPPVEPSPRAADDPGIRPGNLPSAGAVRAVASEAEFLRKYIAAIWFGDEWHPDSRWKIEVFGAVNGQPIPPPARDGIRVMYWRGGPTESSTGVAFEDGQHTRPWINLSGPLEDVLDNQLPREMTRIVLAECFGRPLPWWTEEGMAALAESEAKQAQTDMRCRMALTHGRGVQLPALFTLTQAPREPEAASAQVHSVLRFLLRPIGRLPREGEKPIFHPLRFDVPVANGKKVRVSATPGGTFLYFVSQGMEHSWDKAVREVYGFENVAAVEREWLEWLKGRDSQLAAPAPPVVTPPDPAYPPLIPPVKLSGGQ